VGGEDHKVGERSVDENEPFRKLEQYIRDRFGNLEITHRWSAEYFYSADGLPYIGQSPFGRNKYIATGFTGDGLTFSVVSAMILSDLLTDVKNPWGPHLRPGPVQPGGVGNRPGRAEPGIPLPLRERPLYHRRQGRGRRTAGRRAAGAGGRAATGRVPRRTRHGAHAFASLYAHALRRAVEQGRKTWDCPCHGGRFTCTGEVLVGPPVRALTRKEIKAEKEV
jgi:hypothetical protein